MNTPPLHSSSELPTHIRCAACGKWFKKLGMHLRNSHGISPGEYRARYGIPEEQLLVAPALLVKMQRNAKTMNAANAEERDRYRKWVKELNGQR
jgi:predicted transcriptional regulator